MAADFGGVPRICKASWVDTEIDKTWPLPSAQCYALTEVDLLLFKLWPMIVRKNVF